MYKACPTLVRRYGASVGHNRAALPKLPPVDAPESLAVVVGWQRGDKDVAVVHPAEVPKSISGADSA